MSSNNQPVYMNNQAQQNIGSYQNQQQLQIPFNNNQNYQYRVYQAPQDKMVAMPNNQVNMMTKSGENIHIDGFNMKP
jgi:hypothetical protein